MVFTKMFFTFNAFTVAAILTGCAGPTSPFGAIELFSGDGKFASLSQNETENISFWPTRQVLHAQSDLKVKVQVDSPIGSSHEMNIVYNGRNVTHAFQKNLTNKILATNEMELTFPRLRLRPDKKHNIEFTFRSSASEEEMHYSNSYLPPYCANEGLAPILNTRPFKPEAEILDQIFRQSNNYGLNPPLLAGLIAQESAFQPTAVSWARAVGLTQVTPLADSEIAKIRPDWARDKRIEKKPIWKLQSLIDEGDIQSSTDWRLDPMKSIEGGAIYFNFLREYWSRGDNPDLIQAYAAGDWTPVLLASYNSGAARVKKQMQERQDAWLEAENLKEAFKYVNRVSSYCYHFSKGEL